MVRQEGGVSRFRIGALFTATRESGGLRRVGRCLENLNGPFYDRIIGRRQLSRSGWSELVLVELRDVVHSSRIHWHRGLDAFLGNGFAVGREIVGDRKNQRRAIVQSDYLLLRRRAECCFADGITAMIVRDRSRKDFGGTRRAIRNQHSHRSLPDSLGSVGRESLRRDSLAAQRSNCAGSQE